VPFRQRLDFLQLRPLVKIFLTLSFLGGHKYLARLNSRYILDGIVGGSGAEFVNHSCEPNLLTRRSRDRLFFVSRRNIRAGEELTIDYCYPIKLRRVPCHCGAKRCRGTLRFILS
jgi:SET domain-containing protein